MAIPRPPAIISSLNDISSIPLHFISTEEELQRMTADLSQYSEIAVDLEAREDNNRSHVSNYHLKGIKSTLLYWFYLFNADIDASSGLYYRRHCIEELA